MALMDALPSQPRPQRTCNAAAVCRLHSAAAHAPPCCRRPPPSAATFAPRRLDHPCLVLRCVLAPWTTDPQLATDPPAVAPLPPGGVAGRAAVWLRHRLHLGGAALHSGRPISAPGGPARGAGPHPGVDCFFCHCGRRRRLHRWRLAGGPAGAQARAAGGRRAVCGRGGGHGGGAGQRRAHCRCALWGRGGCFAVLLLPLP